MESDDFQIIEVIDYIIQQQRLAVFGFAGGTPAPAGVNRNGDAQFFASFVERPDPFVIDLGVFRRIELE